MIKPEVFCQYCRIFIEGRVSPKPLQTCFDCKAQRNRYRALIIYNEKRDNEKLVLRQYTLDVINYMVWKGELKEDCGKLVRNDV